MAKQVLQLGMGDAFDDWLIEKIQHLCRGSVVAAGIQRLEQVVLKCLNLFVYSTSLPFFFGWLVVCEGWGD